MRNFRFQTGSFYHVYNRGVDRRNVFIDGKDYLRFIVSMREFNVLDNIGSLYEHDYQKKKLSFHLETKFLNDDKKLVKIICYCLNRNHFHFLFSQFADDGISLFMHKLGLGYTKYFNHKYKRSGSLFQGTYEAVEIKTDEQLLYLSAYINGNPEIHKVVKAQSWPWSSYKDYLNLRNGTLCNKQLVLQQFNGLADYQEYVNIVIEDSSKRKEESKEFLFDE